MFFANEEINKVFETFEESDESYENLKGLYLDGALDEDSSPIDEFRMLIYTQTIWPKPENAFLKKTRGRYTFVNKFWRTNRTDRAESDKRPFWSVNTRTINVATLMLILAGLQESYLSPNQ